MINHQTNDQQTYDVQTNVTLRYVVCVCVLVYVHVYLASGPVTLCSFNFFLLLNGHNQTDHDLFVVC